MHKPTLSRLGGGFAIAALPTWPALAFVSITGDPEVATGERVAPVSAPELLAYVSAYVCAVMSNQKKKKQKRRE